jgi:AraC family transcriptional regulator
MARQAPPVSLGSPRFRTAIQGGLLVTDAWFPPNLVLPFHLHDRTVLAVTLAGRWDSVLDRRPHVSTAGMVLTEPAGERHANHFAATGAHVVVIQPDPARVDDLMPATRFLSRVNHFSAPEALRLARRLSAEIRFPDSATPLAIEGLGCEILAAASREVVRTAGSGRSPSPIWLRRVLDRVHSTYLERLTLRDLATVASVHPAHLAREFRHHYRVSLPTYVRRLRLDWAADRLMRSDLSIAEIAAAAGFADQSHFTRAFHHELGLPPRRFRQAHR